MKVSLFTIVLLLANYASVMSTCYVCDHGCKGGSCCTETSALDKNCIRCGYYGCTRCRLGYRLENGTFAFCANACNKDRDEKCYPGRCRKEKNSCKKPFKCLKKANFTCG